MGTSVALDRGIAFSISEKQRPNCQRKSASLNWKIGDRCSVGRRAAKAQRLARHKKARWPADTQTYGAPPGDHHTVVKSGIVRLVRKNDSD